MSQYVQLSANEISTCALKIRKNRLKSNIFDSFLQDLLQCCHVTISRNILLLINTKYIKKGQTSYSMDRSFLLASQKLLEIKLKVLVGTLNSSWCHYLQWLQWKWGLTCFYFTKLRGKVDSFPHHFLFQSKIELI